MILRKVMTTALIASLAATALAGCGKKDEGSATTTSPNGTAAPASSAAPKSNAKQEIAINFSAEPPALDSSIGTTSAAFTMVNAFNEGLYRLDKDGKPTPGLADGMPTVTDNGLTYTFKIKQNANWADGSPVKASDFVYAYKRTLDPATKAQYSFMVAWIKGGADVSKAKTPEDVKAALDKVGVRAVDDKTLEIKLERPVTFFTSLLAFPIFFPQKEDFVKAQGAKNGVDADKVIGAGPFKLVKWDHGQSLEFVKNDKYWDAANVKLQKFTVNIVKDTQTGQNLYETNAADLTEINGDQLPLYKGKPDYTVKPELVNSYLMFQENKVPAFKNAKIREALTLGIDRQAYVDTVLANGSVASTGLVPTGTLDGNNADFRKTAGDTEAKADIAKAKQLLADGLKELGMTSLPKFKFTTDDTATAKKTVEFILAQWKQNLGVEAIGDPMPHANRVDLQSKHDYDVINALWGADYNDPMTFLDMWITGGEFNEVDWSNKQYDDLISSAQKDSDPAKRAKTLVDAEKLLMQEMPVGPLYFRSRVYLKRPNIDGLILPSYGEDWDLRWVSVK